MVKSPSDLPNHPDGGYISASLRLDGEISGDADLYVDGTVKGKINLGGRKLTVGESGRLEADVEVGEATGCSRRCPRGGRSGRRRRRSSAAAP
jgi:cytoskeletal protein CcmA (bactofilin family)